MRGEVALKVKLRALTQDGSLDPAAIPAPADTAWVISKPRTLFKAPRTGSFHLIFYPHNDAMEEFCFVLFVCVFF